MHCSGFAHRKQLLVDEVFKTKKPTFTTYVSRDFEDSLDDSTLITCLVAAAMKLNIGVVAIPIYFAGAYAVAVRDADAATECGDLGVMTVDPNTLPEGMKTIDVRKCADHPIGKNREGVWQSLAPIEEFEKRELSSPADIKRASLLAPRAEQACYYNAGLGCSGGYCWKACGQPGDGKWCWTAAGDGSGNWLTCKTYNDCNGNAACGKGIGCSSCGCSC